MTRPRSLRAASWIRRATLPVALVCGFLLVRWYGFLRVPGGMDTLPHTHPPGSACIIEKWPSRVVRGAVVFVDLADGGSLLARVAEVRGDGTLMLEHDNVKSRFADPQGERLGPVTLEQVRGMVLVVFPPDVEAPPDGR